MNYAKVVTVLAIIFGVSLGLCGLTAIAADRVPGLIALGVVELVAMALSVLGMGTMLLAWGVSRALGRGNAGDSGYQKLFEDEDRETPGDLRDQSK